MVNQLNGEIRGNNEAYMMSTWSQSAPWLIVLEHSAPRLPKSAERIDGAMIAGGAIVVNIVFLILCVQLIGRASRGASEFGLCSPRFYSETPIY